MMQNIFGAWRFQNKVLHKLDFVFSSMGAGSGKLVIRSAFPGRWKEAVRDFYDRNSTTDEATAMLALMSIRAIFRKVTQEHKDLALYALRNGNRSNVTANHLRSILAGIGLYGSDTIAKAATFEVVGVLQGLDGDDLDGYRQARLLDEVFDGVGIEPNEPKTYWQDLEAGRPSPR